jgi:hypothetical protein
MSDTHLPSFIPVFGGVQIMKLLTCICLQLLISPVFDANILLGTYFSDILLNLFSSLRTKVQAMSASDYRPLASNAGGKSVEM